MKSTAGGRGASALTVASRPRADRAPLTTAAGKRRWSRATAGAEEGGEGAAEAAPPLPWGEAGCSVEAAPPPPPPPSSTAKRVSRVKAMSRSTNVPRWLVRRLSI